MRALSLPLMICLLISSAALLPVQADDGCPPHDLDIPLEGETHRTLEGQLSDDQPCAAWQLYGQAGDRIRVSGSTALTTSVYVIPDGTDTRRLLDRATGTNGLEIELANLLDPGTYIIEVTQGTGDFTLDLTITRRREPRIYNLIALDGLLPVVSGGGPLYECGTSEGVIDFNEARPDGRTRDAGDRWLFYGEAGQPVNLTATFDRAQLPYYYMLEMSIWHRGVPDRRAVRPPGNPDAGHTLAIDDYLLPETGYYTIVISALYNMDSGGPPPDQRRLNYTLNYRGGSCVWVDPEINLETLRLDFAALLAPPAEQGLGFLQYNITAAANPENGTVVYNAVDQTRRGPQELAIVTQFNGLRQTNLAEVARTDNDRIIAFHHGAFEVRMAPGLVAGITYLESILTLELTNGGTFVTRVTGETPPALIVSRSPEGAAVQIDTPGGQSFRSDWLSLETVWVVEDRFFVRTGPDDQLHRRWVSSPSATLRIVSAGEGLSGIGATLAPPEAEPTQMLVTDWAQIEAVYLQPGQTVRAVFGAGSQFITDTMDIFTVTRSDNDTRINLKSHEQNIQLSIAEVRHFGLVQEKLFIDFAGDARAPIVQPFAGVSAFAEERFTFDAAAPVSTGNYIIEWQDGTRAMLLETERQIITPGQISFNPALPPGAANLEQPDRLELALPHDMNNLGAEFCDDCGTLGPYWGLVNPANGNMTYAVTDIYAPGPGLDLILTRTYNSLAPTPESGPPYGLQQTPPHAFGPGWSSDIDIRLDLTGSLVGTVTDSTILSPSTRTGFVRLTTPSGSQHYFYRDLAAVHGSPAPDAACDTFHIPYYSDTARTWHVEQCLNEWRVVRDDNVTYHFDRAGVLIYLTHSSGYTLSLIRQPSTAPLAYPWQETPIETSHELVIKNPYGAAITLHYGHYSEARTPGALRVLRADAPDGTQTFYHYDPLTGNLDRVRYADGREAVYRYEADTHRLAEHRDPHAPWLPYLLYTYDETGRIDEVYVFQSDESTQREMLLDHDYRHDPDAGTYTTAILDVPRDRETRYIFAEATPYRLLRRLDEHHLAEDDFLETTFTTNRVPLSFPRFFKDQDPGPNELLVLGSILEPGRAGVPRETNFTFGFGFDERGRLNQLAEVRSQTVDYWEYDPFGRLARFTDAVTSDAAWIYTYDPSHGMLTQVTDPAGTTTTFCYAPVQLQIDRASVSTTTGASVHTEPVEFHRLTWKIGPYRLEDVPIEFGKELCIWFSEGREPPAFFPLPITSFIYNDSDPYVAEITNWNYQSGGHVPFSATIRRDVMGRVIAVDRSDRRTRYTWGDGRNYDRLLQVDELGTTDGAVYQTCYTYTGDLGQLASITDPLNRHTTYTYYGYDQLHRLASETYYHDTPCSTSPAPENRLYQKTYTYTACRHIDTTQYNRCETQPLLDEDTPVKDLYIRVDLMPGIADSSPVDEPTRYTVYHYDERDDLVETIEWRSVGGVPHTKASCYRYDELGNLTGYADNRPDCKPLVNGEKPTAGRYFTFTYNYNNQLLDVTDRVFTSPAFEGGEDIARAWRFEYYPSPFGDPENVRPPVTLFDPPHSRTWPGLNSYTEVVYDERNRPVEVREFEAVGSRELVRSTEYTYDAWGNITSERINGFDGPTRFYCYDTLNRLASIRSGACTDPETILETFRYDDAGNLAAWTVHNPDASYTYTFIYDAFNRVSAITNPNGHVRHFGYNAAGELAYETDWNGTLITYKRGYQPGPDFAHRRRVEMCRHAPPFPGDAGARALVEAGCAEAATVSFYDGFNRLRSVDAYGMERITYTYDMWGRLTAERRSASDIIYTYDDAGNLISTTNNLGETYHFSYDERGNLVWVQDPLSYTKSYTYDTHNNLIVYEDGDHVIDLFYDGLNRLDCLVYRPPGQPSSREARCNDLGFDTGSLVDFDYDAAGNLVQIRQSNTNGTESLTTTYTYRDSSRLVRAEITGPDESRYAGWRYDYNGPIITATPPDGDEDSAIVYRYDGTGNLIEINAPLDGGATMYTLRAWYDGNGALCGYRLSPEDAEPFEYRFDGVRCTEQHIDDTLEDTPFNFYTYWPGGQLRAAYAVQGRAVRYFYDQAGRLSRIEHPEAGSTYYRYESTARGVAVLISEPLSPNGCDASKSSDTCRQTRLRYDQLGALVGLEQPAIARTFFYDPLGNQLRTADSTGRATLWAHDSLDHITRFEDRTGAALQAAYTKDRFHNLDTLNNGLGQILDLQYDLFGRLANTTNALGARMTYHFDPLYRLVTIFTPQATARLETPGLDPAAPGALGTIWIAYDARGNPVARWDGGIEEPVQYTYDNLGRLAAVSYPQGATYTYTYDAAGSLTRIETAPEVYWAYKWRYGSDREGRSLPQLVEAVEAASGVVRRRVVAYDALNHRTCLTLYENDEPLLYINYGYSLDGKLEHIGTSQTGCTAGESSDLCRPGEEACAAFTYSAGRLSTITRSNGVCTSYTYDEAGNIRMLAHTDCNTGGPIARYAYLAYNGNGAPLHMTINDTQSVFYSYDGTGRLTGERWLDAQDQLQYAMSITYDAAGNRRTVSTNGVEKTYCYDGLGQRLVEIRGDGLCSPREEWLDCEGQSKHPQTNPITMPGDRQYAYDEAGRVCLRVDAAPGGPVVGSYGYDANGRVTQVSRGDTYTFLYYNPLGEIESIDTTDTTTFWYDSGDILRTRDSHTTQFLIGPHGEPPLWKIIEDTENGTRRLEWLLYDGLGSVRLLAGMDSRPLPGVAFDYNGFGEPVGTGTAGQGPRYRGKLAGLIAEVDYYLFGARVHDPAIGRYLQPDPAGPDLANQRYAFAGNHPTPGHPVIDLPGYPSPNPPNVPDISTELMGLSVPMPPMPDLLDSLPAAEFSLTRDRAKLLGMVAWQWNHNGARWRGMPPTLYLGRFPPLPVEAFGQIKPALSAPPVWDMDSLAAKPDLSAQLRNLQAIQQPFIWPASPAWRGPGASRPDIDSRPTAPNPIDLRIEARTTDLLDLLDPRFDGWPLMSDIVGALSEHTPGDMLGLPGDMSEVARWLTVQDYHTWPVEPRPPVESALPGGILDTLRELRRSFQAHLTPPGAAD